jgi:cytochrome c biogenesis protein CcdA
LGLSLPVPELRYDTSAKLCRCSQESTMSLLIVSYLGGVLTILSPCILPVLPFVFARSDQPFVRTGLPLLFGMAVTFAAVATLAAVGGGWAVEANQYGRIVALALLVLFAATLVSRTLADRLWFTEGFDTLDLKEAKALLNKLRA